MTMVCGSDPWSPARPQGLRHYMVTIVAGNILSVEQRIRVEPEGDVPGQGLDVNLAHIARPISAAARTMARLVAAHGSDK